MLLMKNVQRFGHSKTEESRLHINIFFLYYNKRKKIYSIFQIAIIYNRYFFIKV